MNEWQIQNKVKEGESFFSREFIITVPQNTNKKPRASEGQVI